MTEKTRSLASLLGVHFARLVMFRHHPTSVDMMMMTNRVFDGRSYWSALLASRKQLSQS